MHQKTILPNGITVVTESIPYVKSISLGAWIKAGSRFETSVNQGISHFMEHMMFKGTARRTAKEIAETIDEVGGQINAFTAKEHTCYYLKMLDSHRELAVDVLSDMLLYSKLAALDIEREREVVKEEIHMYEDTPDDLVHDLHMEQVWPEHSLGRKILGTLQTVGDFDREKLCRYYESYYRPENIVVAAAGNLEHQRFAAEIEAAFAFGNLPPALPRKDTPPEFKGGSSIHEKSIEQTHICLSTPGVPQASPDIYTLHILNNILGGGISSRLFQTIREEKGLAYSVYSYQTNYSDAGLFGIYAGTRPENAAEVLRLIRMIVADLRKNGISSLELVKAKEQLKGNLLLGLESSSSRMSRLGKLEMILRKYVTLEEVINKIDAVTIEGIKEMSEQLFKEGGVCLTVLGPKREGGGYEFAGF